mmetsp:Transcript_156044/g.271489  ORF Transcript_156044/g.271489 Transcript_156044/m.271489 type:complete len:207 (-) Transcript_156044:470-1090(-)
MDFCSSFVKSSTSCHEVPPSSHFSCTSVVVASTTTALPLPGTSNLSPILKPNEEIFSDIIVATSSTSYHFLLPSPNRNCTSVVVISTTLAVPRSGTRTESPTFNSPALGMAANFLLPAPEASFSALSCFLYASLQAGPCSSPPVAAQVRQQVGNPSAAFRPQPTAQNAVVVALPSLGFPPPPPPPRKPAGGKPKKLKSGISYLGGM